MLVVMRNETLVGKLLFLAGDDLDLVRLAIRTVARECKSADLESVVELVVEQRKACSRRR
jgi:hypothetical protein